MVDLALQSLLILVCRLVAGPPNKKSKVRLELAERGFGGRTWIGECRVEGHEQRGKGMGMGMGLSLFLFLATKGDDGLLRRPRTR